VKTPPQPVSLSPDEVALVRAMVIWEDAEVLALAKPPGLSSQGGRRGVNTLDELLWAFARPGKARPRLIHRLDRDTSGVILAAKTQPAAGFLGKAMMARRIRKTYLAIVTPGAPEPASGAVAAPLRREDLGREAYMRVCAADHPDAQAALTRYRTLSAAPGAALVELSPETGRMHQLRVHLASIGRPIAGDARYGGALAVQGRPAPRLMLHAAALGFPHPAGGTRRIQAPPPADMLALAAALGLAWPEAATGTAGAAGPFGRAP
jgi:tRNA pseudouridine32 synthase/23S rRNA pseudouridine746 synthase